MSLTSVSMFEGSAANASWRIVPRVASTQDARDSHGFGSHGATNATMPYPDESSVTGVSRRSERRSATGLTLVPESSEPPRSAASWSNCEWDAELLTWGTESAREDDRRSAERRDRRSNRRREEAPAYEVRSALYTEDDYRADNGASRPMRRGIFSGFGPRTGSAEDGRVASRSSRREETPGYEVRSAFYTEEDYRAGHGASSRRNRAGRVGRSVEAPSYEVRSAFYTEKDYRAQRGIPGADRRRMAVAEALAAAPRAVGGTLVSVLVRARVLVLILLLALMMLGFYKPVRELYVAQRRLDVLQATYDALAEDNDTISDELYLLQTREGIENEARARGFVEPGETKVIVEGLPEEMAGPNGTAVTVSEVEVNIEDPWYIELFDKVFEYNGEA